MFKNNRNPRGGDDVELDRRLAMSYNKRMELTCLATFELRCFKAFLTQGLTHTAIHSILSGNGPHNE